VLPYAPRMTFPVPDAGRTCLITGASSGIGADLARQLARKGYGVTLVARREDRLRARAEELEASHGIRAEVMACDLSDQAARDAIAPDVAKRGLTVDVLVNNAGFSTVGPVHASDPAREVAMIRTDVEAVAHLCSAFLPGMVARGRGAVLNVASVASFQPLPGQAGYAASKAFVLSYSRALAEELKGKGVTVTVLCPGPVETEFAEAAGIDEEGADALPRFMWVSSADVAAAGIAGMEKGRAVVIPGAPNRIGAAVGHLTPRRLLLPLLASRHPSLK
jgi:short-subunit dehydrogenase